jgi:hypothetical protein
MTEIRDKEESGSTQDLNQILLTYTPNNSVVKGRKKRTYEPHRGRMMPQREEMIAVQYRHIRQVCQSTYFKNYVPKDKVYKDYYCFVTAANPLNNLSVEVQTPILRKSGRMVKRYPVVINIKFDGVDILRWKRKVFWKNDGRLFICELNGFVGRALRLINTEKTFEKPAEKISLVGNLYNNQKFVNESGIGRSVRRALLD